MSAFGNDISRRTRGAILKWLDDNTVPWGHVYRHLESRGGFGDNSDIVADIRDVDGQESFLRYVAAVQREAHQQAIADPAYGRMWDTEQKELEKRIAKREAGKFALLHVPDRLFVKAIEGAYAELEQNHHAYGQAAPEIGAIYLNPLLEDQGSQWRFDDGAKRWVWLGDPIVHDAVVGPALAAMSGPRLTVPAGDFSRALAGRSRSATAERKTAVNEATKALEGVMAAVLESHGRALPDRRQVMVLWDALVAEGLTPRDMQDIVVAGSKVSNKRGRHTNPDDVTGAEAEAAVMSVAVAINYLATLIVQE
jgi:hypothetical protein